MKFKIQVKFRIENNNSVEIIEKQIFKKPYVYHLNFPPNLSDEEKLEKAKERYNRLHLKDYETLKEVISRIWKKKKLTVFRFVSNEGKPGKSYSKVKDLFIPPIKIWSCGLLKNFQEIISDYHSNIFYLQQADVVWKSKWGTPSFEESPYRFIVLFGTFYFGYILHSPSILKKGGEDRYWEQIIWTVDYNDGDFEKAKSTWPNKTKSGKSTWLDIYEKKG